MMGSFRVMQVLKMFLIRTLIREAREKGKKKKHISILVASTSVLGEIV
jgi:hypothetical protein